VLIGTISAALGSVFFAMVGLLFGQIGWPALVPPVIALAASAGMVADKVKDDKEIGLGCLGTISLLCLGATSLVVLVFALDTIRAPAIVVPDALRVHAYKMAGWFAIGGALLGLIIGTLFAFKRGDTGS
jgi:hypothetical protein